jgi:hypothetical protein
MPDLLGLVIPRASALINQLPYGKYCLGTQAKVVGMTTGNAVHQTPAEEAS